MTTTYVAAVDAFLDWLSPRKLAHTTVDAYRQDLDAIAKPLAALLDPDAALTTDDLNTDDLSKDNMRRAFATYAADHAKASILRTHSTWRQFFDFMVAEAIVEGSPMAAINRPKADERKPRPLDGWDEDTVVTLLRALAEGARGGRDPWPELDVAVVTTLLATGVRRSELLAMNLDALEGPRDAQVIRVLGKGAKPRSIPVEAALDDILGTYLESRKSRFSTWKLKRDDPLFVHPTARSTAVSRAGGARLTERQLHYLLDESLRAAGLANRRHKGAMAHAFRHTYGTSLAADGAPVAAIRKLMGHSSINTSQGYIDSLAREEREVAARNRVYDVLGELSNSADNAGKNSKKQ